MLGWLAQLCAACFPQEKWHQLSITIQLWLDFDILSSARHPKVHKAITMMGVIGFWHPVKCMTTSSSAQSHLHDGCGWILTSCQVHNILMMFVTGFWHPVKCINLPRAGVGINMKYIYQKTSQIGREKTMWKLFFMQWTFKFCLNVTVTCTWHGIMTEWGTNTV